MLLLKKLWQQEDGIVLSAEAVLVGTLGVVGMGVGLKAISESVNQELADVGRSLRALDQSYSVQGMRGCHSWTAGSHFRQADPCDLPSTDERDESNRFEKRIVPQANGPQGQPSEPLKNEKPTADVPDESEPSPHPANPTTKDRELVPRIHKAGFDDRSA